MTMNVGGMPLLGRVSLQDQADLQAPRDCPLLKACQTAPEFRYAIMSFNNVASILHRQCVNKFV